MELLFYRDATTKEIFSVYNRRNGRFLSPKEYSLKVLKLMEENWSKQVGNVQTQVFVE